MESSTSRCPYDKKGCLNPKCKLLHLEVRGVCNPTKCWGHLCPLTHSKVVCRHDLVGCTNPDCKYFHALPRGVCDPAKCKGNECPLIHLVVNKSDLDNCSNPTCPCLPTIFDPNLKFGPCCISNGEGFSQEDKDNSNLADACCGYGHFFVYVMRKYPVLDTHRLAQVINMYSDRMNQELSYSDIAPFL